MMKYILLFTIILTSKISFCQINPDSLINILSMNFNQFETFSLMNKFEFNEHEKTKNGESLTFEKHNGIDTTKLSLYIDDSSTFIRVLSYELINKEEFLSIKNFLIQNGKFEMTSFQDFFEGCSQTLNNYYHYNSWKFVLTSAKKNNRIYYYITIH